MPISTFENLQLDLNRGDPQESKGEAWTQTLTTKTVKLLPFVAWTVQPFQAMFVWFVCNGPNGHHTM